jgi:hypothetical protein
MCDQPAQEENALTTEQHIAIGLQRRLERKFQKVLPPGRIRYSVDLIKLILDRVGESTRSVPIIDYKKVRFLMVPHGYNSDDTEATAKYRAQGCSQGFIEWLQQAIPQEKAQQEREFNEYIQAEQFFMPEDVKSLGQLYEKWMQAVPVTYIPESAVPRRLAMPLDGDDDRCVCYVIGAEMPTPKDAPHEIQLLNYVENCMAALVDGIRVTSHATLNYAFRIVCSDIVTTRIGKKASKPKYQQRIAITPRIILYVTVVFPTEKQLDELKEKDGAVVNNTV